MSKRTSRRISARSRFALVFVAGTALFFGLPTPAGANGELAAADGDQAAVETVGPATTCIEAGRSTWSATEIEVWALLCRGEIASPSTLESRMSSISLSAEYVEDLVGGGYADLIPGSLPIVVIDASVVGTISANAARVNRALILHGWYIEGSLRLNSAVFSSDLSLADSTIEGQLILDGATVGSSLTLRNLRANDEVRLLGARIRGNVTGNGLQVGSNFLADGARIEGSLLFGPGTVVNHRFSLVSAQIETVFAVTGPERDDQPMAVFRGPVVMNRGKFGTVLAENAMFDRIDISGAVVDNSLSVTDSEIASRLDLTGSRIGGTIDLSMTTFTASALCGQVLGSASDETQSNFDSPEPGQSIGRCAEVDASRVDVGGNVNLAGACELPTVELDSARVAGDLRLFSRAIDQNCELWRGDGELDLRNTVVGGISDRVMAIQVDDDSAVLEATGYQATGDSWPARLRLDGLTYESPTSAVLRIESESFINRSQHWYLTWLGRSEFSTQPYLFLEETLRTHGKGAVAGEVGMARRDRERTSGSAARYLLLSLYDLSVGYGHRPERALIWAVIFAVLGTIVARSRNWQIYRRPRAPWFGLRVATSEPWNVGSGLAYSLDRLLPVLTLADYTVPKDPGWKRRYFYFHSLVGFVLASFLLAGLTDLAVG